MTLLKKITLLFIIFFSFCDDSNAQKKRSVDTSERIETLLDTYQFKEALSHLDSLKSEAQNNKLSEFGTNYYYTQAFLSLADFDHSLEYLKRTKASKPSSIGKSEKEIRIFNLEVQLAYYLNRADYIEEVVSKLDWEAIDLDTTIRPSSKVLAYNLLSLFYSHIDQRNVSYAYLNKAQKLIDAHLQNLYQEMTWNNLSLVYSEDGKIDKAIESYKKVFDKSKREKNTHELVISCNNLGYNYLQNGRLDSAAYYLELGEQEMSQSSLFIQMAVTTNLRKLHRKLNNHKVSVAYGDKLLELKEKISIEKLGFKIDRLKYDHEIQLLSHEKEIAHKNYLYQLELKKRKQAQIQVLIGLVVSLILTALIIFIFYRRLKKSYFLLVRREEEYLSIRDQYNKLLKSRDGAHKIQEDTIVKNETNNASQLSQDDAENLVRKINLYMLNDKAYLHADFKITTICETIKVNRSYVSEAINRIEGKNFSRYINEFRIQEACTLLKQNEAVANYSIEGIANMVGFKSKSSFYKAFKDIVGVTPNYYLKEVKTISKKKERPID